MPMRIKPILICLLIECGLALHAQELKVLEFRADKSMTDAVRFPKEDLNGNRCGLIKLGLALPTTVVSFEGDIISSEYKEGEWWIYMPKGSNWLTIKSKSHVPLRYEFEPIQSNVTYVMNIVNASPSGAMASTPSKRHHIETWQPAKAFYMLAVFGYSVSPQASYGITMGSVKKTGWYFNIATNFRLLSAKYKCDESGKIVGTYDDGYTDYTYTNQTYNSRFSTTAGVTIRVAEPISIYFGGGYGFRNLYWVLDNGTVVKNVDYSHKGFSFDGGFLMHYGGISLSAGVQSIWFDYLEAKIGIGFSL